MLHLIEIKDMYEAWENLYRDTIENFNIEDRLNQSFIQTTKAEA